MMTNTEGGADNIVVVLDRPQDAVNIGAVVRALKNMGFTQLRLVQPRPYTAADLARVAHHAEDVIARIAVFATLDEALADTVYVVGASAIAHGGRSLRYDVETLSRELLERGEAGKVALLFGTEDDGLDRTALDRCHCIVTLPTNPDYPALNLAQSVLLFLYEVARQRRLRAGKDAAEAAAAPAPALATPLAPGPAPARQPVTQALLEQLFVRSEEALTAMRFFRYNPPAVMRSLRRIAYRAELDSAEVALLLAIARQAAYAAAHPLQDKETERQKP
jgi:TrmH family RNA methyltransferase